MINSDELEIIGNWIYNDNRVFEDDVVNRINFLKENYLIKISDSISGWETLYQDPQDKRYWELVYKQNDLQGGGPPSLVYISEANAKEKYSK